MVDKTVKARTDRIYDAVLHNDGKKRCPWPGLDPLYITYHDTDWGVPEWDSRALFEKLILDGFQAGLSWVTILRKRDNFRAAFDGFQPHIIACYTPDKLESLMQDAGIVRNRGKIAAAVTSAQVFLDIDAKHGFSNYIWSFVDGRPLQPKPRSMRDIPTQSVISEKFAKDLRARGFNYCGPTIVYAFIQAVGLVNDHLVDCFRHDECAALGGAG